MANTALPVGERHDYAPYGQIADPMALDTAILAYSPWAYWKLADGGTGNFADSSGNGRNATAELGPDLRQQAAITSKSGLSVYLANGRIGFPLVQPHLSALSGVWTYMGLVKFNEIPATGSAVGNKFMGSIFLFQSIESTTNFDLRLSVQDIADSGALLVGSSTLPTIGQAWVVKALQKPMVIAVVGTSLPGVYYTFDVWVNGVKMISGASRGNASGPGSFLSIGRCGNTERLAGFYASNWAAWNGELTSTQIMDLTECYLGKTDYAGAWQARTPPAFRGAEPPPVPEPKLIVPAG
jgi:hypothetical protein